MPEQTNLPSLVPQLQVNAGLNLCFLPPLKQAWSKRSTRKVFPLWPTTWNSNRASVWVTAHLTLSYHSSSFFSFEMSAILLELCWLITARVTSGTGLMGLTKRAVFDSYCADSTFGSSGWYRTSSWDVREFPQRLSKSPWLQSSQEILKQKPEH